MFYFFFCLSLSFPPSLSPSVSVSFFKIEGLSALWLTAQRQLQEEKLHNKPDFILFVSLSDHCVREIADCRTPQWKEEPAQCHTASWHYLHHCLSSALVFLSLEGPASLCHLLFCFSLLIDLAWDSHFTKQFLSSQHWTFRWRGIYFPESNFLGRGYWGNFCCFLGWMGGMRVEFWRGISHPFFFLTCYKDKSRQSYLVLHSAWKVMSLQTLDYRLSVKGS